MYRKQGLATSLSNFVKGIAEAHGIGLYASCSAVSGGVFLNLIGLDFVGLGAGLGGVGLG